MEAVSQEQLITQLQGMIDIAKECPKDMMFYVTIEFIAENKQFKTIALKHRLLQEAKINIKNEIKLTKEGAI